MLIGLKVSVADERGYTLVEVLAALLLIIIVVVPIAGIAVANARSADLARTYLRASYLAQARIEELRASPFTDIDSEPSAVVAGAEMFTRAVLVESEQTASEALLGLPGRMKRIVVTVTWDSGRRSVQLATLIEGQTP
ncbi:MAG: hypothetical protein ACM3XN_06580 [Chloroflexota bacterium]